MYGWSFLRLSNTQAFGHLFIKKALARSVGLHPFPVNDKLRDGTLTGLGHHFCGRAGRIFDIDFREGNLVFLQEALGQAAVGAPEGRINEQFHTLRSEGRLRSVALNRHERKGREESKAAGTDGQEIIADS